MVTINKQTPNAIVELKTADGREYSLSIDCTEERKEAARSLAYMGVPEEGEEPCTISIWDLCREAEAVFGKDLAKELLVAFSSAEVEARRAYSNGLPVTDSTSGLWGMFIFSETPQGGEFWTELSAAAQAIVNA